MNFVNKLLSVCPNIYYILDTIIHTYTFDVLHTDPFIT